MADILVQNAVVEIAKAIGESADGINYTSIVGQNMKSIVSTILNANKTTGPFASSSGAATNCLCRLSEMCCISHCQCNFSGSGTSSTAYNGTTNVWRDGSVLEGGTPVVAAQTIVDQIKALETTGVLTKVYDSNSTQVGNDIYFAYLAFKISTVDADILETWYGIAAAGTEVAGVRISNTNVCKVCNQNWKYGEGPESTTWTVPTGASRVKFQVWGAGHGTNPACCCGGQSFGTTGHYAEMTMDATPGESYTICAGCSCSRYCCSNAGAGFGCASGVTGPGICCLLADGAGCYNSPCEDMKGMRCCFGLSNCGRWQNPYCTTSGPCFCGCGEYCYDNSCATCGVVPVYPTCCSGPNPGCSCACDDRNATHQEGEAHRGIVGGGCLETSNYGYHIRPPVIDSDSGLMFSDSCGCYCQDFTSGTCCGGCNGKDWDAHPGMGGAGTHIMGGTTNHKGDTGKSGMVQISWK